MIYLRQSTASQEIPLGYFVDNNDGDTEESGLTINNTDIKIWKNGTVVLANKNSGGATVISNGIYHATLDDTDTDTLGSMVIFVHVAGALTVRLECCVLPANIYDSWILGSDYQKIDVAENTVLNDISVANIIAGIADGTYDLQEMIRIMFAALAGKTTDGGTKFRDSADSKNRIVVVTDTSNNRTTITLDGS